MVFEIDAALWARAEAHLRGAPERVLFWSAVDVDDRVVLDDELLIGAGDIEDGPWCVELTDDAQQNVLRWASEHHGWLIEAHSHLGAFGDPARFSGLDVRGLGEWVPHVRWRLQQRPYAAVVIGPTSIDAVGWAGPKNAAPHAITAFRVAGTLVDTTGLSIHDF